MAGYDTASYIQSVESAAVSNYGTPNFWIRYFSPSPYGTVDSSQTNAIAECRAAWDSGGPYLGVLTSPNTSRLNGTSAEGSADAQSLISALVQVWTWVGSLNLPSNDALYCWLDLEQGFSLSTSYWNGWAQKISQYNWNFEGFYPLYPCLYCGPCDTGYHNCSTVASATWSCYGIWTYQPGYCNSSYSMTNTPSWAAKTCSGCGVSGGPSTKLWQFEPNDGGCHLNANVDLDEGASGFTVGNYCFNISSRP